MRLMPMLPIFFAMAFLSQIGVFSTPGWASSSPNITKSAEVSRERILELRTYAQKRGYSTQYGLFVDFSLFSGKRRFYAVNLKTMKVLHSGLVTHGHCQEQGDLVRFSNQVGSNCSSEGKYSVGKSYKGNFGLAFKLHGLDSTNSNALKRYIVMHAHRCVPDNVLDHEICESEGCPTLSPRMLNKIEALVLASGKPLLLWVYKESNIALPS